MRRHQKHTQTQTHTKRSAQAPTQLGIGMREQGQRASPDPLPVVGQYIESRGCISYTAPYPHGVMLQRLSPGIILGPIREVVSNERFCAVRIGDAWINTWASRPTPTNFASLIPRSTSDTWRDGTVVLVDTCDGSCYELGSDVSSTGSHEYTQATVSATAAASEETEDVQENNGEERSESSISSERIGAAFLGNVCFGCRKSCVTCRRRGPHMHRRSRSLTPLAQWGLPWESESDGDNAESDGG